MKDILQCYKTLGIEPGAAPERVRNAYLQLRRFYDPERYLGGDSEHVSKAAQKHKEIEEAYQAISQFLPVLKNAEAIDKPMEPARDFKEMVHEGPAEVSKTLVAIVLAVVVALILGWGYYIYRETRELRTVQENPAAPVE